MMKSTFRALSTLVFTSLFLSVLSACTGSDSGSKASNQMLRIGVAQEFEILNPLISQMALSSYINHMTTGALTTIDENWKLQCSLCETLPTMENGQAKIANGKMQVNWVIKESAKWADGTPLTGHDIKFAWEVGNNENVSVGERDIYQRISDIKVDEKNPKKLTFFLREKRYDFNNFSTFRPLPKHIDGPVFEKTKNQPGLYEKQTVFNTDPTNPGLYNGAYRVTQLSLGSHIALQRSEHFEPKAHIENIIFKYIPNTQALEANLLAGSVDMICESSGLTFDQAIAFEDRIKSDSKLAQRLKSLFREGAIYEHITFNLKDPMVSDLRVRKALAYGVDREKMVAAFFKGRQNVALHNTHPLDPYYTDDVVKYPYDFEKASTLLDEAGWKLKDDGLRYKDGKPLRLTLMTTAENKTRENVQVYIQAEWKKLGIEVSAKNEPPRVFFGETVRKGLFPNLAMFAWVSSPDNPPRSTMHTSNIPTSKNGYAGQNSGFFSNKEADDLLDKIPGTFEFEKRKEYMKRISQIYADELPALPLFLRAEFAIIPAGLKGVILTGHQFQSSQAVHEWSF